MSPSRSFAILSVLSVFSCASVLHAQESTIASSDQAQTFFQSFCNDCHGLDDMTAGIRTDHSDQGQVFIKDRKNWLKVFEMLRFEAMPPEDADQPSKEQRTQIISWLDHQLNDIDCSKVHDPGAVTIRRLNRLEYNNTIRDLLGVDFQPASDFPADDVGDGFDNNADVLTVSPLLMEKYMDAAEEIAENVIVIVDPENPHRKSLPVRSFRIEGAGSSSAGKIVFHSRGSAIRQIRVPFDGEYQLRVTAGADQAGNENAKMQFDLDGSHAETIDVPQRPGNAKVFAFPMTLAAGSHSIRLGFINDFYDPKNRDRSRRDRNLHITAVEVAGPFRVEGDTLPEFHKQARQIKVSDPAAARREAAALLGPLVRLAFRRPVEPSQIDRFAQFVSLALEKGESFERGMQIAVSAILVSPQFLFRIEGKRNASEGIRELDDYEVASRLAYFLWASMPDKALLALAQEGKLRQPSVLEQQIQRMLADSKSQGLVDGFATQWLNLRNLADVTPHPRFKFNDSLRESMETETTHFFESVMRDNQSILDFIDGRYTFVNEELSQHYGLGDIKGKEFQRVSLAETPRYGILTHGSVLTLTSQPDRTSPVKRGKWIMENILGTPPPDPPEDVPEIEAAKKALPSASFKEQLALHRENATCASCHNHMDPLGFGFENYDAVGRYRLQDGKFPIDPSGVLPTGEKFSGSEELVSILRGRKQQFARALSERMLVFALGRGLNYYDRCAIDTIVKALDQNDYRFHELIKQIVFSEPFLKRKIESEQ